MIVDKDHRSWLDNSTGQKNIPVIIDYCPFSKILKSFPGSGPVNVLGTFRHLPWCLYTALPLDGRLVTRSLAEFQKNTILRKKKQCKMNTPYQRGNQNRTANGWQKNPTQQKQGWPKERNSSLGSFCYPFVILLQ